MTDGPARVKWSMGRVADVSDIGCRQEQLRFPLMDESVGAGVFRLVDSTRSSQHSATQFHAPVGCVQSTGSVPCLRHYDGRGKSGDDPAGADGWVVDLDRCRWQA